MARQGYIRGNPWIRCGVCSWKYRSSELRKQWDGVYACYECWDPLPLQNLPFPRDTDEGRIDPKARGNPDDVEDSEVHDPENNTF